MVGEFVYQLAVEAAATEEDDDNHRCCGVSPVNGKCVTYGVRDF